MKFKMAKMGATVAGAMMLSGAAYAECGSVQIAEMNWASAEFMANVDAFILENGYGCDVELVPGATTTTFASMDEKGEPDVASELWVNAVREPLAVAMEEGRLHSLLKGPITDLGEGWWVTPAFKEKHPELDTVLKILEHPELFPDSEDPSKGALVGCPAGWGCQLANANMFRAFDMEAKGWKLVDPGSGAGLDGSMAKAAERGENWFGYYWSPTALVGKYDMQPVDFGVPFAGAENWDGCIVKAEQDCADPKPSSWTHSEVHTVVTDEFKKQGGIAVDYLSTRIFPGATMNAMLVYMADEQATGEDAAIEFLLTQGDLWKAWVSEDAAAKIEAAL
ncbi:ABC transporter substrate-binding protein [Paramylibacter kogurei]|nr:ABC transporter substrate-binding protein [Amylibacter kogurei]